MSETDNYIGGIWQPAQGDAFTSSDPYNGKTVWQGNAADEQDVGAAVSAARDAFASWAALELSVRAAYLTNSPRR